MSVDGMASFSPPPGQGGVRGGRVLFYRNGVAGRDAIGNPCNNPSHARNPKLDQESRTAEEEDSTTLVRLPASSFSHRRVA